MDKLASNLRPQRFEQDFQASNAWMASNVASKASNVAYVAYLPQLGSRHVLPAK
jgi:hypothetical protein